MNVDPSHKGLADQLLSDDNREVQLLVARGLFPLPPQELLPLQVTLARGPDEELAGAARQALAELEPRIAAGVLADTGDEALMAYFCDNVDHPVIVESILTNRRVSVEVLTRLASRLSPELQEILLLRQDLIVDHPEVLDRLERNPQLSSYAQRRIYEFREHLLPTLQAEEEAEPLEQVDQPEAEEISVEALEAAIAEVSQLAAEGERDEITGLSESQIRALPVPMRLKLARGAPRSLRSLLVKDKNPTVAVSVVLGNALTESEAEQFAMSRSVVEEVLNALAKDRQWGRKYSVVHALVRNPRTSVGLAIRLTPRLSTRDLRNLAKDRNVPEAVRNRAARLYKIKAT